ncbi:MAG: amidase [Nitrososphaerota archaeon]|nr:amidase [Candidatus Calditenuaceae archaeon]MDW8073431.1 amidase [Nitrososphaerota archaeon]
MPPIQNLRELSLAINTGTVSCEEAVAKVLQRIREQNPTLRAYITVSSEAALTSAREADSELKRRGPRSSLHGAPLAVKDIIAVENLPMTAGSRVLGSKPAKRDAESVYRARSAGMVVVGTTNLHEFGAGTTNLNIFFGHVRNPWDTERIAGGSSGGSAAAVAAGLAGLALGTDTGGSVRIPAALCGVIGLKPSRGLISTSGVFPLSWSLDEVGILARSAWDASAALLALSKPSAPAPQRVPPPAPTRPRIGVPWSLFEETVDPQVSSSFDSFIRALEGLGAEVLDVELPWVAPGLNHWRTIRGAEAAAVHRKWLESRPHLYSEEVRENLAWGLDIPAVNYIAAVREREKFSAKAASLFTSLDAIATPTLPITAPRISEVEAMSLKERGELRTRMLSLTFFANLAGLPAVSIPTERRVGGLPVGSQLTGPPGGDYLLLGITWEYELSIGGFSFPNPLL